MKHKKFYILHSTFYILPAACFVLLASYFFFFSTASAQVTISTTFPVPGSEAANGPGGFVNDFYRFSLMIGGILAFGAIVYGGIKYIFAAGNPSGQSEGREWIKGALWGLLLLAGAYLILNVINPDLTKLSLQGLGSQGAAPPASPTPTPATTPPQTQTPPACSLAPLAPITDSAALAMESGTTVVWTSSDANVQRNLTKLQQEFGKLQNIMARQIGGSVTANSVYRPLAYQKHLFDIFQASQAYRGNQAFYDGNSACIPVISVLKAEQQKHGICYDGKPCLVSSPDKCAPHVKGTGIDISVSPATLLNSINTVLKSNNIDLRWQALSSDPVHFNLQNPPFSGCAS